MKAILCLTKYHGPIIFSWITGEWQACSKPCSGGISRRHIYCVELSEGRFLTTYTHMCTEPRPSTERACNEHACPRWYAGSWSPVRHAFEITPCNQFLSPIFSCTKCSLYCTIIQLYVRITPCSNIWATCKPIVLKVKMTFPDSSHYLIHEVLMFC